MISKPKYLLLFGNGQAAIGVSLPSCILYVFFFFHLFIGETIGRPKYLLNFVPKLALQHLVDPFFQNQ